MSECPTDDRLRSLLDGNLAAAEQAELQQHIDSCEPCQQTLESLVAGKESWDGIARRLGDGDTPVTPALHEVINAAKEMEATTPSIKLPPGILQPSEQADSMGRLAHYEILEEVGSGGMGIVLKAFDTSLRRVVAIKLMAPYLAASAAARRRFVREAQAAAAVAHEHVVAIHAVADQHEPPYLAMQFIEGKTLQERLDKSGPLSVREVLRIGMQTAAGLAAAHAQGLVHRDIKPANILLENGVERVKLTDFGLARAVDDASMTQSGVIAGTPLFMSPEQARGETVDHRSDLFSLGSVLYAMCVGHAPFRASTTMGVLKRVCDEAPRPIREVNADIPEWLTNIVAKLLAKRPQDRFESAEEVRELLEECLAHVQQPSSVPLPTAVVGLSDRSMSMSGTALAAGQQPPVASAMPLKDETPTIGVWRDGPLLMMHKLARLPDRCVKTNQPTTLRLGRHLFWHHPILYLVFLFNPLIFLVLARLIGKQADIQIGLCSQQLTQRRWVIGLGWLGFLCGAVLAAYGFKGFDVPLILAGVVVALIAGVVSAKLSEMVSVVHIDGDIVSLKGVCRDYLDTLPDQPSQIQEQSVETNLTSAVKGSATVTETTDSSKPVGWRLRCLTCQAIGTLAKLGGLRLGAASSSMRALARCHQCRSLRWAAIEWGELPLIDPAQPNLEPLVRRTRIGLVIGLLGGLLTIVWWGQRTSQLIPSVIGDWVEHACEAGLFLMAMFLLLLGAFIGGHHTCCMEPRRISSRILGGGFAAVCFALFLFLTDNLAGRWKGWTNECSITFRSNHLEDSDLRFSIHLAPSPRDRHLHALGDVPLGGRISRLPHGDVHLLIHRGEQVVHSELLTLYPGQHFAYQPAIGLREFEKLQGRWRIVEVKGTVSSVVNEPPEDQWIEFSHETLRSGRLQQAIGWSFSKEPTFGISPTSPLTNFDLIGFAKGVYRLDGDSLTISLSHPGEPRPRTNPADGTPTFICRRDKATP